jgi:hypothetical protein
VPTTQDIKWFKSEFGPEIREAVRRTPFTVDMITAIACQETGYIWSALRRKGLETRDVLRLCVGDTIDARPGGKGRRAFPKTKADLLTHRRGRDMFEIGRKALIDMSAHIRGYSTVASNENKFCRGYGIFQYDLQHFAQDPDYFLERRYEDFSQSLSKCLEELSAAQKRARLAGRRSLTEAEMAAVAIAYNRGSYNPAKGLRQGHFDGKHFYGELFMNYLRLAKTVPGPDAPPQIAAPPPGEAILAPPTAPRHSGKAYVVDTRMSDLRVRSEPEIDKTNPRKNVIADLPDGHPVRAVSDVPVRGFLEIETSLRGALVRGFASATYLRPVRSAQAPSPPPPATSQLAAISMPRKAGQLTRRRDPAGAHSLKEPGHPARRGTTPEALKAELEAIIDWLAVDNPAHNRYIGGLGKTFCNIYAHDYCHLAGVYLPRVWWTPGAIERLGAGEAVTPLYGATIREMRANDLFRWLVDFGPRFGWRQTGTLAKLQTEVNLGAIGLIVARRRIEGKSGHIVMVVPETAAHSARRDRFGAVTHPLQSQAGRVNFRRGIGTRDWWRGAEFAESAFWVHA